MHLFSPLTLNTWSRFVVFVNLSLSLWLTVSNSIHNDYYYTVDLWPSFIILFLQFICLDI